MSEPTAAELFAAIEELSDQLEEERNRNKELSASLKDEPEPPKEPAGRRPEEVAKDPKATRTERSQAFADFVHQQEEKVKDKPRHPITGGLLDGPGTPNRKS